MQLTSNYKLKKPEGTDVVNIDDFNTNADIIDNALKVHDTQLSDMDYQTAGGSSTAITLTMQTLRNGYTKTFIASANNGGATTTINGKKLYKPSTTISPNLIAGKAYTVWYSSTGDCFFIKASAEGTALASQVLKDITFSNDNDTNIKGTLDLSNLVSGNIKSGVTINGVGGSSTVIDTADASLDPVYLVKGYSGYDDGLKKAGTMVNRSSENWHQPAVGQTVSDVNGYGAYVIPPAGFYDGNSWVRSLQPDLLAANIISGKNIFGIAGGASITSLGGYKKASFNTNISPVATESFKRASGMSINIYVVDITGFDFTPVFAIFYTPQLGNVYFDGANVFIPNAATSSSYKVADMMFPLSLNSNIIASYGRLRIPEPQHGTCVIYGN